MSTFPIYSLEDFEWATDEQMGTKARAWYDATERVPDLEEGTRWLFKVPNRFPGEVWAEKVAYEIGVLMKLPIARVELAHLNNGEKGTICLNFADYRDGLSLEHGNELMEALSYGSDYHTDSEGQLGLDAVYDYLQDHAIAAPQNAPNIARDAAYYFTGYLVLDALIGNIDRHHQNWGIVRTEDGNTHLAPTFDHGACLGRELRDTKRDNYLQNQQVFQYATNKKGAAKIAPPGNNDRIVPFKLLDFLPDLGQSEALCYWLDRAIDIDDDDLTQLFEKLPDGLARTNSRRFAIEFTRYTREQLIDLRDRSCS